MAIITVCIGSCCHLKGSYDVINGLQELIRENKLETEVDIKASFCLGECTKAVSVKIDNSLVISVSKDTFKDFFEEHINKRGK